MKDRLRWRDGGKCGTHILEFEWNPDKHTVAQILHLGCVEFKSNKSLNVREDRPWYAIAYYPATSTSRYMSTSTLKAAKRHVEHEVLHLLKILNRAEPLLRERGRS